MRFSSEIEGDRRAITFLRKLGKEGSKAVVRATNNTGRRTRTLASRTIREQVSLKAGYVRERLKITRATAKKPEFVIRARRRGVLMTRYPYTVLKSGVTVKISRKGPRRKLGSAFETRLSAGGRLIDVIAVPGPRDSAGRRLRYANGNAKLKVLYSPSVSQVFNRVRETITPEVALYFQQQIDKEVDAAIRRVLAQ